MYLFTPSGLFLVSFIICPGKHLLRYILLTQYLSVYSSHETINIFMQLSLLKEYQPLFSRVPFHWIQHFGNLPYQIQATKFISKQNYMYSCLLSRICTYASRRKVFYKWISDRLFKADANYSFFVVKTLQSLPMTQTAFLVRSIKCQKDA